MCLMHKEAKQTQTSEFGAEKGLLQGPSKENRQFMLKDPNPADGFQGRVFKGKFGGEGCRVYDLLLIG